MKHPKTIFVGMTVLLALAAVSWLGYKILQRYNTPAESPLNAVPGNTALIIQLNQAGNLLQELNRSNVIWRSISQFPGIDAIQSELRYFDSTGRKNQDVRQILARQKIWISITLSGRSSFGALYLTSVDIPDPEKGIVDFIRQLLGENTLIMSSPYSTTTIHRVQARGSKEPFYFAVMKGVFTGSYHINLVKRSIDRLSLNTPLALSPGFRKVESTVGKKADANIYLNYRFFSLVLSTITRDELLQDLLKLSGFADWSGLDLIIKKDELMFNGITAANDSSQHFLSLFSDQEPGKLKITQVIPRHTRFFTSYAWSNPTAFSGRFMSQGSNTESFISEFDSVADIIDRYKLNIRDYYLPWMGGEAAIFLMENPSGGRPSKFLAIETGDTVLALRSLKSLSDSIGVKMDSMLYRGHILYKVNLPKFLPKLIGGYFSKVNTTFFTFYKGYLITGEDPIGLRQIIDQADQGETLMNHAPFTDFISNFSDTYNVFVYFHPGYYSGNLRQLLNDRISSTVGIFADSLRNFESVAFQFSNTGGLYYSNFFLRYNPHNEDESALVWETSLDTSVAYPPRILDILPGEDKSIVSTDVNNNLYLFNADGTLNWKMPVMGNLIGDIKLVRIPGRDSAMLFFNTDTHLYLLHADGKFADKYPLKFPMTATNEATVVWESRKGFSVLIAFHDNRLYKFSFDGKSVPDWSRPKSDGVISHAATVIRHKQQDFIFFSDINGNTQVLNLRGEPEILLPPGFRHSPNTEFYLNRGPRRGVFLTSGPSGKIILIQPNGKVSEATLNKFSDQHSFFYADITGNGAPEFIIADQNKLFFYNRDHKLTFSYAFRREINQRPFLISAAGSKARIGFVVPETRELFLFDGNGHVALATGISGTTRFDAGVLKKGLPEILVVGSGKMLKTYRLTKL